MPTATKSKPSTKSSAKSNGKATPPKATSDHPAARKAVLKRAGLSEGSELSAGQVERADSEAAKTMSAASLGTYIMKGTGAKGGKSTPRKPRPDGKLSGLDAARKVLKGARNPVSAKVAAERLLKIKPAPITGKYAQANAQKKFYDLVKSGEAKRDKDGNLTLA